jgi:hypothetical protein
MFAPSEMTRIAVGGTVPSLARCRRPSWTPSETASPSDVPSPGCNERSACRANARSAVGGSAIDARPEKPTTPTRNFSGIFPRKALAASRAAASLVGRTSFARIDSDVSTARITVASSRGTLTVACGLATPTTIAVNATSSTASGRCRRHLGDASTRFGNSPGVVNRDAYSVRRLSRLT